MAEHRGTMQADERARLAVLDTMAGQPVLWNDYVLKGGLALYYAYESPRRSYDLDFTSLTTFKKKKAPETDELLRAFCPVLDEGLAESAAKHGFHLLQSCWQRLSEQMPILYVRVGYVEDAAERDLCRRYVEMQVTLSEVVCEARTAHRSGVPVHVPSLEDVLAEKLKALLQQVTRGIHRPQDLFDVWYYTLARPQPVDADKVTRFLLAKTAQWPEVQPVTRARFQDLRLLERASTGYAQMAADLAPGVRLPPPSEAYAALLRFADRLDLPVGFSNG
ncbi:MAG TPA: nucleotidyl transferase AbiEii/AbiGii toxin family protein [Rhodothermales bacterium]|nr:nucleotidyl transferase AbiEii/AbiGii toxin family protein [Rhodothermales bacterium]